MGSSTLLGRTSGPTINNMEAGVILSKVLLENIVMDVIEAEGRGVTMAFSTDTEAAQIKAMRVLPLTQKARRLGATINGGVYNSGNAEYPQSEVVMLNILDSIDGNIDVPNQTQSMINVNILDEKQKQIAQLVTKTLNALTIAGKIKTTFGAELTPTSYNSASDDLTEKVLQLSADLDEGDSTKGIQFYPKEGRVYVFRSSFRPTLLKKGIYVLGGANYLYDMIKKGTASPEAVQKGDDGYIGDFDDTPIHCASSQIWSDAEAYLGLPSGELSTVYGYCSSAMANSRGLAHDNQIKIIDSPDGPGIRLQPQYRFGFESWYATGNRFLVNSTFANFVTKIKTLYSNYAPATIPEGSRMSAAVAWSSKTCTVTLGTSSTAAYLGYKFVATAPAALTAVNYINATAATNGTGTFTSGSAITFATAGTFTPLHLVILTDGTVIVGKGDAVTNGE